MPPLPRIHPSRPLITIGAIGVVSLAAATLLPVSQGRAHAATFGTPVVVSGDDVSEPGIDVAPDGTLYVNAPVGVLSNIPGSPSKVYRSTDGGASWTTLPQSLKANLPGGGDSDITIAPDGTLSETDLWLGDSTVATSSDKGQTWTANPVQGPLVQDRQWVAATSGGRVYHVVHQIPTGLWVARSVDSGLTYPQQVVAATALDQTGWSARRATSWLRTAARASPGSPATRSVASTRPATVGSASTGPRNGGLDVHQHRVPRRRARRPRTPHSLLSPTRAPAS